MLPGRRYVVRCGVPACIPSFTYVLGGVVAGLDVGTGSVGELSIPDEVLGAVQTAPVPVGTHDGTDEVGVVLVGG